MKADDREVQRRLARLRQEASPAPGDKQRILSNVAAALELAPPAAAPGSAALAARTSVTPVKELSLAQRRARWLGAGAACGLVGLMAGFWLGHRAQRVPESTPVGAPVVLSSAPAVVAVPTSDAASTPSRDEAASPTGQASRLPATPRRNAPAVARASEPRRASFTLSEGLELLARAERALHAADPALALALLGDLDRRAPRAMLRQERLTTQVLAACATRDVRGALDTRQQLQLEFPESIYSGRLERSCTERERPANLESSGH